jgi:hypothetical protein
MTRPRLIAGLAIPVVLAIAIVLVLFTNRDPESPPTTLAAAPTTAPPTTQPAQDEWLTIVRQIIEKRHALYASPEPERLDEIYDKGCPCYKQEHATLEDLRRRSLHYDDRGVQVQRAKLISRAQQGKLAAVEVVVKEFPKVLKDQSGRIVEQSSGSANVKTVFELVRGSDNRWRVYFLYRPSN